MNTDKSEKAWRDFTDKEVENLYNNFLNHPYEANEENNPLADYVCERKGLLRVIVKGLNDDGDGVRLYIPAKGEYFPDDFLRCFDMDVPIDEVRKWLKDNGISPFCASEIYHALPKLPNRFQYTIWDATNVTVFDSKRSIYCAFNSNEFLDSAIFFCGESAIINEDLLAEFIRELSADEDCEYLRESYMVDLDELSEEEKRALQFEMRIGANDYMGLIAERSWMFLNDCYATIKHN